MANRRTFPPAALLAAALALAGCAVYEAAPVYASPGPAYYRAYAYPAYPAYPVYPGYGRIVVGSGGRAYHHHHHHWR